MIDSVTHYDGVYWADNFSNTYKFSIPKKGNSPWVGAYWTVVMRRDTPLLDNISFALNDDDGVNYRCIPEDILQHVDKVEEDYILNIEYNHPLKLRTRLSHSMVKKYNLSNVPPRILFNKNRVLTLQEKEIQRIHSLHLDAAKHCKPFDMLSMNIGSNKGFTAYMRVLHSDLNQIKKKIMFVSDVAIYVRTFKVNIIFQMLHVRAHA